MNPTEATAKVKEIAKKYLSFYLQGGKFEDLTPEKWAETEEARTLIDELAGEDWVRVEDRLPEGDVKICLVYGIEPIGDCKGYFLQMAYFQEGTDAVGKKINYWDSFPGEGIISYVTHWKPLPQPPKT